MRWMLLSRLVSVGHFVVGGLGARVLIWQDNFDGDSLNATIWAADTGNGCDQGDGLCGWGNFEKQTYTLDNHEVSDGVLAITADIEPEPVDERWYTSSRIRSKAPVSFLTGRIEARIQLPAGLGLWAAFWMLPSNSTRGVWAATGEIDIMEAVNDMDSILGTIHYGGEYPDNRFAGCKQSSGLNFAGNYHLYAIEWEMNEMRWYVDEQLYCQRTMWTSDLESFEPYRAPFDTEFELLLNLAVGGSLPGRFVDDTIFPATMLVDYIRVYNISTEEPEAEPFLGLAMCLPGTIEAEAFDIGGLGLGYGETQPEGGAGTYRMDGAGLVGSDSGRTFVANLTEGDWLAYSVVAEEADYEITLQVSTTAAAALQLVIGSETACANPGDSSITALLAIQATGASGDWGTMTIPSVSMPAGTHQLKLCITGGVGTNIDSITFALVDGNSASNLTEADCAIGGVSRPYMFGQPWAIPGYIEAEYYDYGGLGVGYMERSPTSNFGSATLRWPDGVDIIEAESNPHHGHYVGNWEYGDWLAYTSRAKEAGYWDVGASVASGSNGTMIEFRILVNATNCSSVATDGFDGLGSEGVDLLSGPLFREDTGSWEAFELVSKEDVWVPEGEHRVLFCADSGMFNLNYLWFYTPNPTPAPTMVPTPSPTMAPQAPSDDGIETQWIYISVGVVLFVAGISRLGWIVYLKEDLRRRKPSTLGDDYDSSDTSREDAHGDLEKVSPMHAGGHAAISQQGKTTAREMEVELSSVEPTAEVTATGGAAAGGYVAPGSGTKTVLGNEKVQQQRYRSMFEAPRDPSRVIPRRFSSDVLTGDTKRRSRNFSGGTTGFGSREVYSRASFDASQSTGGDQIPLTTSNSGVQPVVSPVESSVSVGSKIAASLRTPRASAGLDVEVGGSLWDRVTTVSPVQKKPMTPVTGRPPVAKRDQFEDALYRALDSKWDSNKLSHGNPMRDERISRSTSFSEGVPRKNAMLAAGKCWTCVCKFENSLGQEACLGCGRVAPIRRPSDGSTPTRKRLPPHRMQSWIPPPTNV